MMPNLIMTIGNNYIEQEEKKVNNKKRKFSLFGILSEIIYFSTFKSNLKKIKLYKRSRKKKRSIE